MRVYGPTRLSRVEDRKIPTNQKRKKEEEKKEEEEKETYRVNIADAALIQTQNQRE